MTADDSVAPSAAISSHGIGVISFLTWGRISTTYTFIVLTICQHILVFLKRIHHDNVYLPCRMLTGGPVQGTQQVQKTPKRETKVPTTFVRLLVPLHECSSHYHICINRNTEYV